MNFRTAIVFSVVLHLVVLSIIYFLPTQKAPEQPKVYTVSLLGPAELAPKPATPPPAPRGIPRPTPPPVRPATPPSKPKPPTAVSPQPPKATPAPAPKPKTTAPAPSGPSTPPGVKAPTVAIPGKRPGRPGLLRPSDIQDIIDQIAKAPTQEETKGAGITFDTREYRYRAYMDRLKDKIEGVWEYPKSAAEKGIYGDLVIQFTIRKDGSLANAKIVRTSGYQELDQAALKALHDGVPYWPLPAGWPEDSLTVNGHFIYTLWGSYLR